MGKEGELSIFLLRNLKERHIMEGTGVNRSTLLEYNLKKQVSTRGVGLIRIRTWKALVKAALNILVS
jgi:hypothetical protein